MKEFLFIILVILLTPIYLILCFLGKFIDIMTDITEPIAEGMRELFETMTSFWKKIFIKERGELSESSKKN